MPASPIWISRADLIENFRRYGIRKIADLGIALELWETGWGEGFVLTPTDGVDYETGHYEREFVCERIRKVIERTKPRDWDDAPN